MEIQLHNNARLHLDWLRDGSFSIQVYQPGCDRDGAGYLLTAWSTLDDDDLIELLRFLARQHEGEAA
jgi:hypothetical protein